MNCGATTPVASSSWQTTRTHAAWRPRQRADHLALCALAWLTNTGVSGGRLYWENWGASFFAVKGVKVPTAVSVFPDELYPAPKSWAERAYPKLLHYNRLPKGGHFAAWEQPELLTQEIRDGFRSLR